MRIGVIVDNDLINDNRVLREITILKGAGNEVFVLCFAYDNKEYPPIQGIRVKRIRIARRIKNTLFFLFNTVPLYNLLWKKNIICFLREFNPEVIHVHDLYMSKSASRAIEKSKQRVISVLDLHENFAFQITTYNWTRGPIRSLLSQPHLWAHKEEPYLKMANKIVVLSESYRDYLVNKYMFLKPDNFLVFPNVPDLKIKPPEKRDKIELRFPENHPIIMYYGIVAERRGIFDALEVFHKLITDGRKLYFLVIGPVDKQDTDRFSKHLNREQSGEYIKHIPWINSSSLFDFLELSDICIAPFRKNPQHESGVANKIFEYMLGAKPVIATDCKPQQQVIEQFNCGLVYRNSNELEEAIIKLSENPTLCHSMGKNGLEAVLKHFNTDVVANSLIAFYSNIKNELEKK